MKLKGIQSCYMSEKIDKKAGLGRDVVSECMIERMVMEGVFEDTGGLCEVRGGGGRGPKNH